MCKTGYVVKQEMCNISSVIGVLTPTIRHPTFRPVSCVTDCTYSRSFRCLALAILTSFLHYTIASDISDNMFDHWIRIRMMHVLLVTHKLLSEGGTPYDWVTVLETFYDSLVNRLVCTG